MRFKGGRAWLRALLAALLLVTVAAFGGLTASAEGQEEKASDIVQSCQVRASRCDGDYESLWDNRSARVFSVVGEGEQYLQIDLQGKNASGIYIKWGKHVSEWTLEVTLDDETIVTEKYGTRGLYQEYVELPEYAASFRMITADGQKHPLNFVELEVYTPGKLPSGVHMWEPTPATAEIMFIATHQDDEILYFGGAIPYYSGELNYDTITVYTAYDNNIRIHEALEGLWTCGATQHPVFLYFPDVYCETIYEARNIWNQDEVTRKLTELIVKYRPQVIITQDENGEYGHGQHRITVDSVKQALVKAADANYIAEKFPEHQPWTVSKCYLHLYWKNKISMPWGSIYLPGAGGLSALEVARKAFLCHKSQQIGLYSVSTTEKGYDCRSFGLYWTTVGSDVNKNDFFENVPLRYIHVQPPEEQIPVWLERVGTTGWLYRRIDDHVSDIEYVRHCSVNGVEGWYAADETGCLTEPAQRVQLIKDDYTLDVSEYNSLTQVSTQPPLYEYNDGRTISTLLVRYCSVGNEPTGFYLAKSDGSLSEPYTRVEVSDMVYKQQVTEVYSDQSSPGIDAADVILVFMCVLLAVTAIILSITVLSLGRKRKLRRRR